MILKQLKKANASLTQELKECKTNLDESSRALGEATSSRDSSLIALQTKQTELEKYTALNDLTIVNQKHDEASQKESVNWSPILKVNSKREKYFNDVNTRTNKPNVVPISASKPKRKANKSVATPHKKIVASDTTIQKSKSYYKELYENTNKEWKWKDDVSTSISPTIDIIVLLILFIVDSGCTKHMTGNLKLLCNFVEKFLGTICFGNDQFAPILGYGDLNQGNVTIKWVDYVEGLNHNLFSVGQLCDADLEVAFRKSTCFVRDL
ncbi:hypothetical protein Tco_0649101 [Tanacetum coccineum]